MILVFDTETSGLPLNYKAAVHDIDNWPRVVQLGFALYDEKGNEQEAYNKIIRPNGFQISEEVAKVHKITMKRAMEEGIPIGDALDIFKYCMDKAGMMVAHNLNFDKPIVLCEMIRHEIQLNNQNAIRPSLRFEETPTFCTMLASTDICCIPSPYGHSSYKWPKLEELHQHLFDKPVEGAHDALADVRATARCFFEMARLKLIP